jgi:hypothetical protein
MTEKNKGSMVQTWNDLDRQEQAKAEAEVHITEMEINSRTMLALEKIADLLELFAKIELKKIDPDVELVVEEETVYTGPDEFLEEEEEEEEELPEIPKPDNLENEAEMEKYVKDILKPVLTDSVLAQIKVEVSENVVKVRLPWLNNTSSYRGERSWSDLAYAMRNNGFEWVASGRDSHWKSEG